jgi:hypothetical protein
VAIEAEHVAMYLVSEVAISVYMIELALMRGP